jgi:hypothetical protein
MICLHSSTVDISTFQGKGALLLAVVGAKLSEGLNFSDELARMVMVVGLPFPNLGSAELQERLKHADRIAGASTPKNSMYGAAGKELYENMCMNSVNQSIGTYSGIVTVRAVLTLLQVAPFATRTTGRCSSLSTCVTNQKRSTTSCLGGLVNPLSQRSRSGKRSRLLVSFLLVEDDIDDDTQNAFAFHSSMLVISDITSIGVSVNLRNDSTSVTNSSKCEGYYEGHPKNLQDNTNIQKVQDTSECDNKQDCILDAQAMRHL